jgi:hypothetical protein
LVLARIVEPTSKEDNVRVLDEVGVVSHDQALFAGLRRRAWRERLTAACAKRTALGPRPGDVRREHAVLRDRPR